VPESSTFDSVRGPIFRLRNALFYANNRPFLTGWHTSATYSVGTKKAYEESRS